MDKVDLGIQTQIYRPSLISYIYRLTGSMEDARDIAQETFLKLLTVHQNDISHPKAWLFKVATNLAMDLLRSAKRRREEYIGPWLPEPYFTEYVDLQEILELDESLSFALLTLMEKLSPKERIVYILHDVFEFQHSEIAEILEITTQNSRQLNSRAMKKLDGNHKQYSPTKDEYMLFTSSFMNALRLGKFEELKNLLSDTARLITDGGGKVVASRRILDRGNAFIANFLVKVVSSQFNQEDNEVELKIIWLNGSPNLVQCLKSEIVNVFAFKLIEHRIQTLYILRNPEKLKAINSLSSSPIPS